MNVEIISARPADSDFIAWIAAQGMHMDSVPLFLRNVTLNIRTDKAEERLQSYYLQAFF